MYEPDLYTLFISDINSDDSSLYNVRIDRDCTVREFAEWTAENRTGNSSFSVWQKTLSGKAEYRFYYRGGGYTGLDKVPDAVLDARVMDASAIGDWGGTSFTLRIGRRAKRREKH